MMSDNVTGWKFIAGPESAAAPEESTNTTWLASAEQNGAARPALESGCLAKNRKAGHGLRLCFGFNFSRCTEDSLSALNHAPFTGVVQCRFV